MSPREIETTIEDFARAAALAREAGYDGVEVMGSEGYLLTQFLAPRTNQRKDDWGGRSRTACASRSRSCGARAPPPAAISSSSTASPRSISSKAVSNLMKQKAFQGK